MVNERHEVLDLKDIGLPEIPLLGRYRHRQANRRLDPHRHIGCLELCCLVRGKQTYRIAAEAGKPDMFCRLSAGDVFITMPDELHDTAGQPCERGELLWLHLNLRPVRILGLDKADSACLKDALSTIKLRHFSAGKKTIDAFAELHSLARKRDRLSHMRVASSCLKLLIGVVDAAGSMCERYSVPALLDKALHYVQDNLHAPLTVSMVARGCGVSGSWLQQQLLRVTGMPPGEYILREKIELARKMLLQGNRVTDVAHDLGFSSSQYFATVFKRFTAISPSEWVKRECGQDA